VFSGIVEEVGKIVAVTDDGGGRRLKIAANSILSDVRLGDSISCAGVCLTVTDFGGDWFVVEAIEETLRRTKLGVLKTGDKLNLERALRVSDRLGGHIVSGHVDALAAVSSIKEEGFSRVIEFATSAELEPYFIEKGSVTIDGVSLTVAYLRSTGGHNSATAQPGRQFHFAVALIPHTLEVTTLSQLRVGDKVNIEADVVGKYIARLVMQGYTPQNINKGGVTLELLSEHGYT
jgi:riboflavin synthase